VKGDLDDPNSLQHAVKDVESIFLMGTPCCYKQPLCHLPLELLHGFPTFSITPVTSTPGICGNGLIPGILDTVV
jgi:hypothetical protein